MNCEIIKDLLPLYIDDVCSPATKAAVEEHLQHCPDCKTLYQSMAREISAAPVASVPNEKTIYLRIRRQLGNLLLCAILFIAFIALSFGVMNEIGNHGWQPGLFAVVFVVPCSAFLLSMAAVILLKKASYKPWFCWISAGITLGACAAGELYALNHYRTQTEAITLVPYCAVIVLIFTVLSFFIAKLYSKFCRR